MTIGSPSSSSIAPRLGRRVAAQPPKSRLGARVQSPPRDRTRPSLSRTACEPKPAALQGRLLAATATALRPLHVLLRQGLGNSPGKAAPGPACLQSHPPARSGAAGDSPARGGEKPLETAGAAAAQLRVRGPGWPLRGESRPWARLGRAQDPCSLWVSLPLLFFFFF